MSSGDMAYTVPLDGSRRLMQPPFTPAGVVITNRTDRIVTVQDGRGWSRSVRPGAVGRYAIDRPDSNYIGQLAAVATTGECRVTFTQTPIVETGEPAAEGPRIILTRAATLTGGDALFLPTTGGSRCDLVLVVNSGIGAVSIVGTYGDLDCFLMTLALPSGVTPIVIGMGSDIPLPDTVEVQWQGGTVQVRATLRS